MTTAVSTPRTQSLSMSVALACGVSALWMVVVPSMLGWAAHLRTLSALIVAAAIVIAVVDLRTLTLPNRFVAPLAAAAVVQVMGGVFYGRSAVATVTAAAVVFGAYAVMAALGWCGFGDAKFAGALTLLVALYSGFLAIYLVPVAILLSSVQIAVSRALRRPERRHPHGPAIAAAAVLLVLIGLVAGLPSAAA